MKIAVVTPYYQEDEAVLRACHESVRAQSHPATHILVADGHPQVWLDAAEAQHFRLPLAHRDYGDTPRAIASLSVAAQGFDAVAYLDADNWYQPNHIETLVRLRRETGAAICSTMRSMHRLDGSLLGWCHMSDGEDFVDTNCLGVFREAFHLLTQWALMPAWAHVLDDRMIWHVLRDSGLRRAHSDEFTVCYRDSFARHYRLLGEEPPPGTKSTEPVFDAIKRWDAEGLPPFRKGLQIRPAK